MQESQTRQSSPLAGPAAATLSTQVLADDDSLGQGPFTLTLPLSTPNIPIPTSGSIPEHLVSARKFGCRRGRSPRGGWRSTRRASPPSPGDPAPPGVELSCWRYRGPSSRRARGRQTRVAELSQNITLPHPETINPGSVHTGPNLGVTPLTVTHIVRGIPPRATPPRPMTRRTCRQVG
jgi:hypothetical protein